MNIKKYNWQQDDWPNFQYDLTNIYEILFSIAEKAGLINGTLNHLTENLQTEAIINLIVEEAIKTSEIEGEYISRPDVRSSIKNKLGINQNPIKVHDKRAQGVAELLFDARNTFQEPLTESKLFEWHLMLMSSSINSNLRVGYWRTHEEAMQVISSRGGRSIVHFEAPPSVLIPHEMEQFIFWFNNTAPGKSQAIPFPPIRAAIAHLYFESIHPFEDGNGRIGRAIAEKALSQGFGYPILLSLSESIETNKKTYYEVLHQASKSNEITPWLHYFVELVLNSQIYAENQINFILKKVAYFDKFEKKLNARQLKVIRRMIDTGIQGFEGGMSAKKYKTIADTSKATATRDLQDLVLMGALSQVGEGRSVRYNLKFEAK